MNDFVSQMAAKLLYNTLQYDCLTTSIDRILSICENIKDNVHYLMETLAASSLLTR